MTQDQITLGFDRIIEQLQQQAVSQAARRMLADTAPIMNEGLCLARMEQTTAARRVLEAAGAPPLGDTDATARALDEATRGGMLLPAQLNAVARFCVAVRRTRRYLKAAEDINAGVASWQGELPELEALEGAIDGAIREDAILDDASPALRDLRRRRERAEQALREKLNQVLTRHRDKLADGYVTQRGGAWVVPVQKRCRSAFPGRAVDTSAKGNTVFMEPTAVTAQRQTLEALLIDIDMEERRVLFELSDRVAGEDEALRRGMRAMAELDALFARAKLSVAMGARPVALTARRELRLLRARHPLLDPEKCVPLDIELAAPDAGIAVTGPNTGGKTVCLKTVGLLTLMAQSGLHIPCGEGSVVGMMDAVLCDIGDSQSLSQNLSTFSGHMTNVIRILGACSRDSLVLLDELGSGTDPAEGSGLAAAILEELLRRECFFLVTTHDPQIKLWAERATGVVSARMAFDRVSLRPLYRLELGKSGESCAIEIAGRLGMDPALLKRARQIVDSRGDGPVGIAPPDVPGKGATRSRPASRLQRLPPPADDRAKRFRMGDSVALLPERKTAIVYRPADDAGNVIIQIQGEKRTVRHNRLALLVPAEQLYPADYDFSIVFDTVANRKAAHTMARKHDPEAVVVIDAGSGNRDTERPENSPVDCFQRGGVGRPKVAAD